MLFSLPRIFSLLFTQLTPTVLSFIECTSIHSLISLPQGGLSCPADVVRSPMYMHHVHLLPNMHHSCGLVTFISLVI